MHVYPPLKLAIIKLHILDVSAVNVYYHPVYIILHRTSGEAHASGSREW